MVYRLKAKIWVQAYLCQINTHNAFGAVAHQGDHDAGGLYIRVNGRRGQSGLLAAMSDIDGHRIWQIRAQTNTPDAEIDAIIERETKRDRDLWVLEIEDGAQRHFLDDPIEGKWHTNDDAENYQNGNKTL